MKKLLLIVVSIAFVMGACSQRTQEESLHTGPSDRLKGTYTTEIPGPAFDEHDLPRSNGGTWYLTMMGTDYQLENESGFRITEEFWTNGTDFYAEGQPAPEGVFVCKRFGRPEYEGSSPVVGIYKIRIVSGTLTLSPEDEPCDLRDFFLSRTWDKTKEKPPGADV